MILCALRMISVGFKNSYVLYMDRKYPVIINRVIDGDSLNVDIDLGFNLVLSNRSLRLIGIDTPELRTRDLEEKKYGLLAKEHVTNWCSSNKELFLIIKHHTEDMDKFGRILGDLFDKENNSLVQNIIDNHHGVAYFGQNKDLIRDAHALNREKLLEK